VSSSKAFVIPGTPALALEIQIISQVVIMVEGADKIVRLISLRFHIPQHRNPDT
jgi:hypothetical protein